MNLPFPGERPIAGYFAFGQLLSIRAGTVDYATKLIECERVGIAEFLHLQLGGADHFFHDPWKPDVYPDYAAPIAWADVDGLGVVKAVFGFWPKFMQPDRVDDNGKTRRKLDTVNARSETVGESRLYARHGELVSAA